MNTEAARKIQTLARGFVARLRIRPILQRRREAARYIQKFIRSYQMRDKLRGCIFNRKHYGAVVT